MSKDFFKPEPSKGEITISRILDNLGITYLAEFSLPNCKFRYDFCLFDYNILIELDGYQHFEFPNKYHKSKKEYFDYRQKDVKKTLMALKAGYQIIRLHYDFLELPDNTQNKRLSKYIRILIERRGSSYGYLYERLDYKHILYKLGIDCCGKCKLLVSKNDIVTVKRKKSECVYRCHVCFDSKPNQIVTQLQNLTI